MALAWDQALLGQEQTRRSITSPECQLVKKKQFGPIGKLNVDKFSSVVLWYFVISKWPFSRKCIQGCLVVDRFARHSVISCWNEIQTVLSCPSPLSLKLRATYDGLVKEPRLTHFVTVLWPRSLTVLAGECVFLPYCSFLAQKQLQTPEAFFHRSCLAVAAASLSNILWCVTLFAFCSSHRNFQAILLFIFLFKSLSSIGSSQ